MGVGYPLTLPSIVQLCGSAGPGSQRTQIPPTPEKGPQTDCRPSARQPGLSA